jgi:hypothetical protein
VRLGRVERYQSIKVLLDVAHARGGRLRYGVDEAFEEVYQ